jgi:hypothetical protein
VKYSPPLHCRSDLGTDTDLQRDLMLGPKADVSNFVSGHSVNVTAIVHRWHGKRTLKPPSTVESTRLYS